MKQALIVAAALSPIPAAAIAEDFPPLQRVPVLEEVITLTHPSSWFEVPISALLRGSRQVFIVIRFRLSAW